MSPEPCPRGLWLFACCFLPDCLSPLPWHNNKSHSSSLERRGHWSWSSLSCSQFHSACERQVCSRPCAGLICIKLRQSVMVQGGCPSNFSTSKHIKEDQKWNQVSWESGIVSAVFHSPNSKLGHVGQGSECVRALQIVFTVTLSQLNTRLPNTRVLCKGVESVEMPTSAEILIPPISSHLL